MRSIIALFFVPFENFPVFFLPLLACATYRQKLWLSVPTKIKAMAQYESTKYKVWLGQWE
jgi:hypothetical protein